MLKITLDAPQVGALVAGRQQVEAGLDARRAPVLFFSPPSAIDRCGGEGGSSDVSVKAARLRQSPTEPRKEETRDKKGGKRSERPVGRWTDCVAETRPASCSPRTDTGTRRHGALRGGRPQREIIMERQTGGRRSFPLLASRLRFSMAVFCSKTPLNPTEGWSGVLRPRWVFLTAVLNRAVKFIK